MAQLHASKRVIGFLSICCLFGSTAAWAQAQTSATATPWSPEERLVFAAQYDATSPYSRFKALSQVVELSRRAAMLDGCKAWAAESNDASTVWQPRLYEAMQADMAAWVQESPELPQRMALAPAVWAWQQMALPEQIQLQAYWASADYRKMQTTLATLDMLEPGVGWSDQAVNATNGQPLAFAVVALKAQLQASGHDAYWLAQLQQYAPDLALPWRKVGAMASHSQADQAWLQDLTGALMARYDALVAQAGLLQIVEDGYDSQQKAAPHSVFYEWMAVAEQGAKLGKNPATQQCTTTLAKPSLSGPDDPRAVEAAACAMQLQALQWDSQASPWGLRLRDLVPRSTAALCAPR